MVKTIIFNGYNIDVSKEGIIGKNEYFNKKNGYVSYRFGKKTLYKHRAIALAFIPNTENKPCVNHKNGIKTDNRVENLEWNTYKENTQHSFNILFRIPGNTGNFGERMFSRKKIIFFKRIINGILGKKIAFKAYKLPKKAIKQYSLSGCFIRSYNSLIEASEVLGINKSSISHCLTKRYKSGGGFIWKYDI